MPSMQDFSKWRMQAGNEGKDYGAYLGSAESGHPAQMQAEQAANPAYFQQQAAGAQVNQQANQGLADRMTAFAGGNLAPTADMATGMGTGANYGADAYGNPTPNSLGGLKSAVSPAAMAQTQSLTPAIQPDYSAPTAQAPQTPQMSSAVPPAAAPPRPQVSPRMQRQRGRQHTASPVLQGLQQAVR